MFCTKCGKQIAEGAKFCPGCGAPTGRVQQGRQESGERPARQSVQTDIPRAAGGGRNLKVMLAAFLGVLALAGIGAGIFFLVSGRGKGGDGGHGGRDTDGGRDAEGDLRHQRGGE